MQIKINQISQSLNRQVKRFSDIRFASQVVFAVIVLLVTWSGIKSVQTNYGLQKQIAALTEQNSVQQLQNNNLSLQNQYLNSNQYLELAARRNFALALPGEKEIVVPVNVAMAYTSDLPNAKSVDTYSSSSPTTQKNFESWISFFMHRKAQSN